MIVAISGKKGHGKDEVARILRELFAQDEMFFDIKKFATPITEIYKILYGVDFHDIPYAEKEQHRSQYIALAEGIREVTGRRDWTTPIVLRDYKPVYKGFGGSPLPKYIFSDLRLTEEVAALQPLEAVLIRVYRPGQRDTSTHFTEVELDNFDGFDFHITNNGTLDNLWEKVESIYQDVKRRLLWK